jgi:hypothetical protein
VALVAHLTVTHLLLVLVVQVVEVVAALLE